ncbi:MAG TPA: hypothetical protein VL475_03045 [Planctomycetaceae bacterium]|nr:hypothetical protein [Planctomycetaceae bacterium]
MPPPRMTVGGRANSTSNRWEFTTRSIALATVIVWGLVSTVLLTLFVVPVLYRLLAPRELPPGD